MPLFRSREGIGLSVGLVSILLSLLPWYLFLLPLTFLSWRISYEVARATGTRTASLLPPSVMLLSCMSQEVGLMSAFLLALVSGYRNWSLEEFYKALFLNMYAGYLLSYLYKVKLVGTVELLKLLLFVFVLDVASYYIGKKLGKRPFFPRLSPKKTWEGFLGGAALSCLFSLIFLKVPLYVSAVLVLAGVSGDLFKSFIKRQVGIKDFSQLLGEHGGFTDRFDSLVFAAPLWYYWLKILAWRI